MGGKDYFLKFPGIEEYMKSGKMREYVGDLEVKMLADGTHFMQEQLPVQVNQLIINFLNQHIWSASRPFQWWSNSLFEFVEFDNDNEACSWIDF